MKATKAAMTAIMMAFFHILSLISTMAESHTAETLKRKRDEITRSIADYEKRPSINCVGVTNAAVSGNVTNTATGTLHATTFGWQIGISINNRTVNGTVVNAGAIRANDFGIFVQDDAIVTGGVTISCTVRWRAVRPRRAE
jgi:hypothetical protein